MNSQCAIMDECTPSSENAMEDLLLAVKIGKIDRVQQFIDSGAALDKKDSQGNTSLHHAILKMNAEMVQLLLNAGASPNLVNNEGDNPLLLALKSTNDDAEDNVFENQLLGVPLDLDTNVYTKDRSASNVKSSLAVLVQQLINAGANVDDPDSSGVTTWQLAFLRGDFDLVRLLLDAKEPPPNLVDQRGDSMLQLAIRSGEIDLVQRLIDAGADVNYFNSQVPHCRDSPRTPLHDAVNECNVDILKLLLDHGADPNEHSVLPAAGHARSNKIPMLGVLLDHGANVFGDFVFREFLEDNDVEGVKLFLDRGFDVARYSQCAELLSQVVKIWDKNSRDSIQNSKRSEDTRMLSLFLNYFRAKGELSFEMEMGDWRGWSALHDAAKEGKSEHLRLLLRAGADPNLAARDEITPLEWALLHDYCFNFECIQLLIEAGAKIQDSVDRLLNRISEAQRALSNRDHSDRPLNFKIDDEDRDIAKYLPLEDWKRLGKSHFRWALRSMKKAFCIVKYRALLESKGPLEEPTIGKIERSGSLQIYYEACVNEIAYLRKCQFDNLLTYHDLLAREKFYRHVKSLRFFEKFRNEYIGKVSGRITIYMDDLKKRSESACDKFKLWTLANKGLECLIGLNRNAHHLIFSDILDCLGYEDLRNLSMVCDIPRCGCANSDASLKNHMQAYSKPLHPYK